MKWLLPVLVAWMALALPAGAQVQFLAPDGQSASVQMTLDANGKAVPVSPSSGMPVSSKPSTFTPLGCRAWQAITTASPVLLSAVSGGIPAGATLVDIVPSVTVVMRDDGSAPTTAGPGIPIQTNTIYPYSGTLSAVQFIAQTTSGTISACFYR